MHIEGEEFFERLLIQPLQRFKAVINKKAGEYSPAL